MRIKRRYGKALRKLLPFPSDWHILKTFQLVLMKVYYTPGLRELGKKCGYRRKTLSSLETANSFKRIHYFLLQTWEAMYREMLKAFCLHTGNQEFLQFVLDKLKSSITDTISPNEAMINIENLLSGMGTYTKFKNFLEAVSKGRHLEILDKFCFQRLFCLYLAIYSYPWK